MEKQYDIDVRSMVPTLVELSPLMSYDTRLRKTFQEYGNTERKIDEYDKSQRNSIITGYVMILIGVLLAYFVHWACGVVFAAFAVIAFICVIGAGIRQDQLIKDLPIRGTVAKETHEELTKIEGRIKQLKVYIPSEYRSQTGVDDLLKILRTQRASDIRQVKERCDRYEHWRNIERQEYELYQESRRQADNAEQERHLVEGQILEHQREQDRLRNLEQQYESENSHFEFWLSSKGYSVPR